MGRFLSAVAVAIAVVHSARFKKTDNAHAKYIAGIPVLNDNMHDPALAESTERGWIAMLDKKVTNAVIGKLCAALGKGCIKGHSQGVPFVSISATESFLGKVVGAFSKVIKFFEPSSTIYAIPEMSANAKAASWGLDRVGTATRRATGKGSNVYVLDTGVRVSHSDFEGRAIPGAESLGSAVKVCGGEAGCARDVQGHGTHCAGSVGGKKFGVAPGATIYSLKVLGDNGSGSLEGIMLGMDWVATDGERPAVASMSLGAASKVAAFEGAVDGVFEAGVVVVVAAGNSNMDACGFSPAWVPNAITVGSTDIRDRRSSFSCYGKCVDIWAPGSDIVSASHRSDTGSSTKSGTSMACPHVAGAVAALFEEMPSMTSQTAMKTLKRFSQANAISGLKSGDTNTFLWVGAEGAAPPGSAPAPGPAPAPSCRRRLLCLR